MKDAAELAEAVEAAAAPALLPPPRIETPAVALVRGLQRSAGNAAVSGLLQREVDDDGPIALDDAPAPACPAGVSEAITNAPEVPVTVTAESPVDWLNEVKNKLVIGVGHVDPTIDPQWCIAGDGKSVQGVSVKISLKKAVARPVRGHGLSGTANDAKWANVQAMAKSINDHEDKHIAIYVAAMTGIAQKMAALKPAKGRKLTDKDVAKVWDDAWCGAQKKQEELDAAEGNMTVSSDELSFTVSGAKHDYTKDCKLKLGPAAKP